MHKAGFSTPATGSEKGTKEFFNTLVRFYTPRKGDFLYSQIVEKTTLLGSLVGFLKHSILKFFALYADNTPRYIERAR
jgi:hypothetical protein